RWKLGRVGRRPGDAQSIGAGLAQDYSRDLRELAADLIDQFLASQRMGFRTVLALVQQSLDSSRRRSDQPRRTIVEPAALCFAGFAPGTGNCRIAVEVGSRSATERIDQPQRMAHACEPRNRLGVRLRPLV